MPVTKDPLATCWLTIEVDTDGKTFGIPLPAQQWIEGVDIVQQRVQGFCHERRITADRTGGQLHDSVRRKTKSMFPKQSRIREEYAAMIWTFFEDPRVPPRSYAVFLRHPSSRYQGMIREMIRRGRLGEDEVLCPQTTDRSLLPWLYGSPRLIDKGNTATSFCPHKRRSDKCHHVKLQSYWINSTIRAPAARGLAVEAACWKLSVAPWRAFQRRCYGGDDDALYGFQ